MMSLKHYQFAQRLQDKAFECGKLVVRSSEAYTSKTNSWTGDINHKLGGAKFIKCETEIGPVRICRDLNGARGYFLRALRDTSLLHSNVVDRIEEQAGAVSVC